MADSHLPPKKELGQHWLHDEACLRAIVAAADLDADDTVLEIGPGLGTLTRHLVDTGANILALEYDDTLIEGLNTALAGSKNLKVQQGDIRTFNFVDLPAGYKIVANIPYYLTSHLIRSISDTPNPPSQAVLLVQKEVAERMCSGPGSMSILAVTAQFYFETELGVEVPAGLFTPPPKVDSQVVILKHREQKLFDVDDKDFFRVVKAGFSEKRKTLRNSLAGGLRLEKAEVEKLLSSAGIRPSARAQELSLHDWYKLYVGLLQG